MGGSGGGPRPALAAPPCGGLARSQRRKRKKHSISLYPEEMFAAHSEAANNRNGAGRGWNGGSVRRSVGYTFSPLGLGEGRAHAPPPPKARPGRLKEPRRGEDRRDRRVPDGTERSGDNHPRPHGGKRLQGTATGAPTIFLFPRGLATATHRAGHRRRRPKTPPGLSPRRPPGAKQHALSLNGGCRRHGSTVSIQLLEPSVCAVHMVEISHPECSRSTNSCPTPPKHGS